MTPDAPRNITLPDGDYVLIDGAAWFTIDGLSIRIARLDDEVSVSIYTDGEECDDPLASCSVPL